MKILSALPLLISLALSAPGLAQSEEIGCVTTTWKLIGANHKVCVEAFKDAKVPGVTCHVSQARTGGVSGSLGLAQDPSQVVAQAIDEHEAATWLRLHSLPLPMSEHGGSPHGRLERHCAVGEPRL